MVNDGWHDSHKRVSGFPGTIHGDLSDKTLIQLTTASAS